MANLRVATAPASDMKAPRKGKVGLIILLSLIALILTFIVLTALNVFGLRDNILYPALRNVPLVGNMIPSPAYGEAEGYDLTAAMAELEAETQDLAAQNASLEAQLENLTGVIEQLERENERLAGYAAAQEEHMAAREAFYNEVLAENPDAFINFYATMNPEIAHDQFISLSRAQFEDERWLNYLASWNNMNPAQVAAVVESMRTTDMSLITVVMAELPVAFRGSVLNLMDAEAAAAILRHMQPQPGS